MDEIKKHSLALSFIAMLVFIKFVLVPVYEWQSESILKLTQLQRKADKINNVINKKEELEKNSKTLDEILNIENNKFFTSQANDKFKISQQQKIEQELAEFNLRVTNIGWQSEIDMPNMPFRQFQLEIGYQGMTADIIKYLLSIEAQNQFHEITILNMAFRRHFEGGLASARGRVRFALYMHKGSESAK